MKLDKVRITNFRCFESLEIPLQPDVNVLVGVNGSGKTAILDAIAIALFDVVAANFKRAHTYEAETQGVALKSEDIHVPLTGRSEFTNVKAQVREYYRPHGFTPKSFAGEENVVEWTSQICFSRQNGFEHIINNTFSKYFDSLRLEYDKKKARIPFPVAAYYRVGRQFREMPKFNDPLNAVRFDILAAYIDALNAGADYRAMCQWFYYRENSELREKLQVRNDPDYEFPDLKAARKAVIRSLENAKRVFFKGEPPILMVELESGQGDSQAFAVSQLSDGYRNLLGIVLDFSRRLAQGNPPEWENPLEAPGILLIDEIELHLHPKWQQAIIPRLREIFPNTQLIVATHSPQVLTTVESRCISIIRDQKLHAAPAGSYGAESKRMLETVLGASSRPPEADNAIVRDLRKLFELINKKELDAAQELADELFSEVGGDEPALIEAQTIIENRRWEAEAGL